VCKGTKATNALNSVDSNLIIMTRWGHLHAVIQALQATNQASTLLNLSFLQMKCISLVLIIRFKLT